MSINIISEVKKKQQIIIIAGNKVVKYYHKSLGKPITTTSPFRYNIIAAVYDQLTGMTGLLFYKYKLSRIVSFYFFLQL